MAVIVSTDQDFQDHLKNNPKVVVKYFATWCGSCRLIAPKFRKMSENPDYEGVVFLDVDAEKNPEARKLAGVSNLPFFATFQDGEMTRGDFTAKAEAVENMIKEII